MQKSLLGKNWRVANKRKGGYSELKDQELINILLENRGLNTKKQQEEFLSPKNPIEITIKDTGISTSAIKKAINRIKKAIEKKEKIIIYGDYDADGISATAVLWEALNGLKADVLPYIPDRFSEGYGLNAESVQSLKQKTESLKLIITVDNGIVANKAVEMANKLGIDVIITDHHQIGKVLPKAHSIIHTTEICGSGIAWFLAKELGVYKGLDLVSIGTIADQVPLLEANRALVKFGLKELNNTKRLGLLALLKEARVKNGEISTYTVAFIIAPRINAMGRLKHGIDSLRLLCTKNLSRAEELSRLMGKTNKERQQIVDDVLSHAKISVNPDGGFIVISHTSYHEGVIGLAAGKLAEEFGRPAIVISQGELVSKASARSISGINIMEVIESTGDIIISGGGHEMAAGFTLETKKLPAFIKKISQLSKIYLTKDVLKKTLKVDTELNFGEINTSLSKKLESFNPTGTANPAPTFVSKGVQIEGIRLVGADRRHLKLSLVQDNKKLSAIAFGMGEFQQVLANSDEVDVVYSIEENAWNGNIDLQLKIKDIKI